MNVLEIIKDFHGRNATIKLIQQLIIMLCYACVHILVRVYVHNYVEETERRSKFSIS